jgi:Zn-dependent protease
MDPFGTLIVPALAVVGRAPFIFGWPKPLLVYLQKLRHPKRDMFIVAAAGPFANLVLAVGSDILLHVKAFFPQGRKHDLSGR